jgi:hypothetical protein
MAMHKLQLVLRGDHGGELDRADIPLRNPEDPDLVRQVVVRTIETEQWALAAGDVITIEAAG